MIVYHNLKKKGLLCAKLSPEWIAGKHCMTKRVSLKVERKNCRTLLVHMAMFACYTLRWKKCWVHHLQKLLCWSRCRTVEDRKSSLLQNRNFYLKSCSFLVENFILAIDFGPWKKGNLFLHFGDVRVCSQESTFFRPPPCPPPSLMDNFFNVIQFTYSLDLHLNDVQGLHPAHDPVHLPYKYTPSEWCPGTPASSWSGSPSLQIHSIWMISRD